MTLVGLVGVGIVLIAAVGAGTVVHELSHAALLRAFGVRYEIEWLPGRDDADALGVGVCGALATVTPRALPRDLSPWRLRTAAVAPFLLATPGALTLLGLLPDPFLTGNVYLQAATIGWLACALPSPRDFSLFWHAGRVVDDHADRSRERP